MPAPEELLADEYWEDDEDDEFMDDYDDEDDDGYWDYPPFVDFYPDCD